jgi:hypothetical protein
VDGPSGGGIGIVGRALALVEALGVVVVWASELYLPTDAAKNIGR